MVFAQQLHTDVVAIKGDKTAYIVRSICHQNSTQEIKDSSPDVEHHSYSNLETVEVFQNCHFSPGYYCG